MSHLTTSGRRALASAALLGLLVTAAACGSQTETATDPGVPAPGPAVSEREQGQSDRALEADALRAAQGQLPPTPQVPPGR
jgi:hypothetical protein